MAVQSRSQRRQHCIAGCRRTISVRRTGPKPANPRRVKGTDLPLRGGYWSGLVNHAARRGRPRRKSSLARLYMECLSSLRQLTYPSFCPLIQDKPRQGRGGPQPRPCRGLQRSYRTPSRCRQGRRRAKHRSGDDAELGWRRAAVTADNPIAAREPTRRRAGRAGRLDDPRLFSKNQRGRRSTPARTSTCIALIT